MWKTDTNLTFQEKPINFGNVIAAAEKNCSSLKTFQSPLAKIITLYNTVLIQCIIQCEFYKALNLKWSSNGVTLLWMLNCRWFYILAMWANLVLHVIQHENTGQMKCMPTIKRAHFWVCSWEANFTQHLLFLLGGFEVFSLGALG